MTNETLGTPLERFSIWYQSTLEPCIDVRYKDMVEALKKEALEAAAVVAGSKGGEDERKCTLSVALLHCSPAVAMADMHRVWLLSDD